ncbi:50S ribosomal protein L18 [Patescibacteria group bacterium]|nr:50S ribosomal protein L18 [Patescibacteria group bacterium]
MELKAKKHKRRKRRIRTKVFGTKMRPRLSVYRSSQNIYAQIINDEVGKTLVSISNKSLPVKSKQTKLEMAETVGLTLAQKAVKKKITMVVFDRSGYKYHGRVKALAEGARKGGLEF